MTTVHRRTQEELQAAKDECTNLQRQIWLLKKRKQNSMVVINGGYQWWLSMVAVNATPSNTKSNNSNNKSNNSNNKSNNSNNKSNNSNNKSNNSNNKSNNSNNKSNNSNNKSNNSNNKSNNSNNNGTIRTSFARTLYISVRRAHGFMREEGISPACLLRKSLLMMLRLHQQHVQNTTSHS